MSLDSYHSKHNRSTAVEESSFDNYRRETQSENIVAQTPSDTLITNVIFTHAIGRMPSDKLDRTIAAVKSS